MKIRCTRCSKDAGHDVFHDSSEFHADKRSKTGYLASCKKAQRKQRKALMGIPTEEVPSGYKKCSTCKDVHPINEFVRDGRTEDGRRHRCKWCDKQFRMRRDHALTTDKSVAHQLMHKFCMGEYAR